MMNIAFCGLRHPHIFSLLELAQKNDETDVVGAWEEDAATRSNAAASLGVPFYESYEALLADPRVQIVAVGDYFGIRGARTIQALQAGKHVLSDKPLCTSLAELDEIKRLATEKSLAVGCMLELRYDPLLRLVAKTIRGGLLGEIHAMDFTGQHPLNYGVRPMWYFEQGKHGGTFNDLVIHGIDFIQVATGLAYKRTVSARQYNGFAHRHPEFKDCAQLMAEYENGAGLLADVSYSAPAPSAFTLPGYWRFSFWGENGMIECTLGKKDFLLALSGKPAESVKAPPQDGRNCLEEFLREIKDDNPLYHKNHALETSRIGLIIQQDADRQSKEIRN